VEKTADCRVLIVDDDVGLARALARVFRARGVTVEVASSAAGALDSDNLPDLALIDIVMPFTDGVGLARALRDRWPELPVVFMTGGCPVDLRRQAERIGPVLGKPLVHEELVDLIDGLVPRRVAAAPITAEVAL